MEEMDLHSPQLFDNSLAVGSSGLDEEMERFINLLEATPVNRHVKEESPLSKESEGTVLETGLGDCKLSAEEESLRRQQVLEKNKRAQKKFREKQKARISLGYRSCVSQTVPRESALCARWGYLNMSSKAGCAKIIW